LKKKIKKLVKFFEKVEESEKLLREGRYEESYPIVKECSELLPECIMEEKTKKNLNFSLIWNLGKIEEELKRFKESLVWLEKASVLAEKLNRFVNLTEISNDIGRIYFKLENFSEALRYFVLSLEKAKKIDNQNFLQVFFFIFIFFF
jgi:tetratricopeptide (TPR) repeat protein